MAFQFFKTGSASSLMKERGLTTAARMLVNVLETLLWKAGRPTSPGAEWYVGVSSQHRQQRVELPEGRSA